MHRRDFVRRRNRLLPGAYVDAIRVSLTLCTAGRRQHFSVEAIVRPVEQILSSQAAASRVELDAYCFMPDHLHILVTSCEGVDLRTFAKVFKQRTGFWFSKSFGGMLWQRSYYDHILRREEDTTRVAAYILNNPVRKALCQRAEQWPFSWSRWAEGLIGT